MEEFAMAKDWDYAKMSQQAAAVGGPDIWIETIKNTAYSSGASDMKKKLVAPLLVAGVGLGSVGVVGYQKICKCLYSRKKEKLLETIDEDFWITS